MLRRLGIAAPRSSAGSLAPLLFLAAAWGGIASSGGVGLHAQAADADEKKDPVVQAAPREVPPPPDAPDKKTAPDASYTIAKYLDLGLPDPDRAWTGADLTEAHKLLEPLSQAGNQHLPRFGSERSGKVFARLTAPTDEALFKDRKAPLEVRMQAALKGLNAVNQILVIYLSGFSRDEVGDLEMVELMGAQLRSIVVVMELSEELRPTIPKDDPNYKARMQGFATMRQGLAMVVSGSLTTLTERDYYRLRQRARMLAYIQETLPQLLPLLPPEARTEALGRLETLEKDPLLKDLRPGLVRLRAAAKEAAAAAEKKEKSDE